MPVQSLSDTWFLRRVPALKVILRVLFGVFWLVDGILKFEPGVVEAFPSMIRDVGAGQPPWLAGWFSFWATTTSSNPVFFVYSTGVLEVAIGVCLVAGLARKTAYGVSFILSLIIWSVPEGFGGPYGPGSTDIGTGVVYAMTSLLFLVMNAVFGPSRYSLDALIEKRWPGWKALAEIRSS